MDYRQQYAQYLQRAEDALQAAADCLGGQSRVAEAARYSLFSGGKRVRAVLCLAVCDMLGGDLLLAARYAAALEMLHCYSLIHDDLPFMDNDDMRRGKPSCHKAYGEDTALLAGDALLTGAFQVLAQAPGQPRQNTAAAALLAQAAGTAGMSYGQELDLYYEGKKPDEAQLATVHRYKTGMLLNAAAQLGAVAADARPAQCRALEQYAFGIGLVFQIVDDILDVTSTQEELGKPTGSDAENGKVTFATLLGAQGAREEAARQSAKAEQALEFFGPRAGFLHALAQDLLERRK